jgi:hypothetical protein
MNFEILTAYVLLVIAKSVNNVKISKTIKTIKTFQVVNSTHALIYNMMKLLLSVKNCCI